MTDDKLIEKIRKNDDTALKYIYMTHRDHFIQWSIQKFNIDYQDAKDIFQDSIIALRETLLKKGSQEITVSIRNYLFGIGKNLTLQMIRKKIKTTHSSEDYHRSLENDSQQDDDTIIIQQMVAEALEKMSDSCKNILELYYLNGLRMGDIAKKMKLKNDITAKSQKYRCLNLLRKAVFKTYDYHEI